MRTPLKPTVADSESVEKANPIIPIIWIVNIPYITCKLDSYC